MAAELEKAEAEDLVEEVCKEVEVATMSDRSTASSSNPDSSTPSSSTHSTLKHRISGSLNPKPLN